MAIRRTKAQKQQAQAHRVAQLEYRYEAEILVSTTPPATQGLPATASTDFFGYSPSLILQDLLKTQVITGLLVGVLLVAAWYWK